MRRLAPAILLPLLLASCAPPRLGTRPVGVLAGIDALEADGFAALRGKRIGLITNQTGRDRRGRPTAEVLAAAPGVTLVSLFSPEHGFFFWTPLALVALTGLFTIRDRRIGTCLLLAFLSQIYIAGCVASWTVAGAFGQRRFVCLTALLVVGLAALWDFLRTYTAQVSARGLRTAAVVTVALCVWWNVALMAQFATRLMDRQRLEPARNAYHAFVTLPRMAPSLAWRYLVDRESFYDSRNGEAHR